MDEYHKSAGGASGDGGRESIVVVEVPIKPTFVFTTIMSSPAVSVPLHQLHESPNSRSIDVNGWFITTTTNPISNASECDLLQASLGIPLPEMTFGNNNLTLEHRPSGWKYSFSTKDALSAVKKGELGDGDGGVKVDYADAWLKSR